LAQGTGLGQQVMRGRHVAARGDQQVGRRDRVFRRLRRIRAYRLGKQLFRRAEVPGDARRGKRLPCQLARPLGGRTANVFRHLDGPGHEFPLGPRGNT